MTFEDLFRTRALADYGVFLLPSLRDDMAMLDCGCGPGSITYELAGRLDRGRVVGFDRGVDFRAAREYERSHPRPNLAFARGDVDHLPFADGTFDALFAHSLLEMLPRPVDSLQEMHRVLKRDGVIGVAAVDYGGVVLAGPGRELLERFYAIKERIWLLPPPAQPRRGRDLRSLLALGGFRDIVASARYVTYGTPDAVRAFGEDRARECESELGSSAVGTGLASEADIRSMAEAWRSWGASDGAFLAFAWCAAVGRK